MKERPAQHLAPLAHAAHQEVLGRRATREPWVAFYPYTGTKSTVRERDGRLLFRLSDHLQDAPAAVLSGILQILVCRLRGIPEDRADAACRAAYERFVHSDAVGERRQATRRRRGRKHLDPIGHHRSLLEAYLRVTTATGIVVPDPPRLSWAKTASRRRFGHHDPDHDCIVLSRVLDDPAVPEFVLDYVVYHELLHIVYPPIQGAGSKRIIHHKRFRQEEARFPRRKDAEDWLTRISAGRPIRRQH